MVIVYSNKKINLNEIGNSKPPSLTDGKEGSNLGGFRRVTATSVDLWDIAPVQKLDVFERE